MSKSRIIAIACASLLASPACVVPQEPARAAASATTPSTSGDLDFLVGSWDVVATSPSDGTSERIRYDVRPLTRASWLTGRGSSDTVDASDVWGRDPVTGEIMRIVFDGSGTYAVVRSPGWADGQLVLEGDARSAGGTVRIRETIRTVSENEFTATWEAWRNGSWSAYSIERASRRLG